VITPERDTPTGYYSVFDNITYIDRLYKVIIDIFDMYQECDLWKPAPFLFFSFLFFFILVLFLFQLDMLGKCQPHKYHIQQVRREPISCVKPTPIYVWQRTTYEGEKNGQAKNYNAVSPKTICSFSR